MLDQRGFFKTLLRTHFKNPFGCNYSLSAACPKKFIRLTQVKRSAKGGCTFGTTKFISANRLEILQFRFKIIFQMDSQQLNCPSCPLPDVHLRSSSIQKFRFCPR